MHKSLFRGVTMRARIGPGFPIFQGYFCFCSEDERLLYQIFLRINNPCFFFRWILFTCRIHHWNYENTFVFLVNKCFIITTPRGGQCLGNIMNPSATRSVGSLHCFIMGLRWFFKFYRNYTFFFILALRKKLRGNLLVTYGNES